MPLFPPPLPLFSRPAPNFILVHPSTICSAKDVKIVAFLHSRANSSCHKVRSSRACVGRFPLGLDDLTLWHDELPDYKETLLFSHVSYLRHPFGHFSTPSQKKKQKIIPNGKVQNTHTYVTLGKRLALRIGFRRPCRKI